MHHLAVCGVVVLATLAAGCSDSEKARAKAGIRPTYDKATGKLTQLTLDSNGDGRIDTWTDMDGARPILTRIDRNGDGRVDRWEYYDSAAKLLKVGFSQKDDGKPDAWAFSGPDGKVLRVEISSTGDEKKIDRREFYNAGGLAAAEDDTNGDGATDTWETYKAGVLASASFDENQDGKADRRLSYEGSALVLIETAPDGFGGFATRVPVR
jgi:hypothetical protein